MRDQRRNCWGSARCLAQIARGDEFALAQEISNLANFVDVNLDCEQLFSVALNENVDLILAVVQYCRQNRTVVMKSVINPDGSLRDTEFSGANW